MRSRQSSSRCASASRWRSIEVFGAIKELPALSERRHGVGDASRRPKGVNSCGVFNRVGVIGLKARSRFNVDDYAIGCVSRSAPGCSARAIGNDEVSALESGVRECPDSTGLQLLSAVTRHPQPGGQVRHWGSGSNVGSDLLLGIP
jgi:hypothetical protein